MPDSQLEEARRCTSCQEPGVLINRRPVRVEGVPRGTVVELNECRSDRCPDYLPPQVAGNGDRMPASRNRWAVQINPDGTVPPKGTGRTSDKAFEAPAENSMITQAARDRIRLMAAQDDEMAHGGQAHEIGQDLRYRGSY
jgi:hypothetical protein